MYSRGADFADVLRASLDCDGPLEHVVVEDVDARGMPLTFSLNDGGSVDSVSGRRGSVPGLSRPKPEFKDTVDSRSSCTPGAGSLDRRTAKRLSEDIACYSHRPSNFH